MANFKGSTVRRARRSAGVLGAPADRSLMLSLVVEMTQIAHDLHAKLGVTPDEQRRAETVARVRRKSRSRPSEALMATLMGASDVLSLWRRDPKFIGADGSPRVLQIRGKSPSLESLVRLGAPHVPLNDILAYICSHGEVSLYKGDKVALLGTAAVMAQRTPEMTLAWMLTQFRHFAETAIQNSAISMQQVKGVSLFQRQVEGWLSDAEFAQYSQAIRPRLQEVCDQLEVGLIRNGSKRGRSVRPCGVGLFVYRSPGKKAGV